MLRIFISGVVNTSKAVAISTATSLASSAVTAVTNNALDRTTMFFKKDANSKPSEIISTPNP